MGYCVLFFNRLRRYDKPLPIKSFFEDVLSMYFVFVFFSMSKAKIIASLNNESCSHIWRMEYSLYAVMNSAAEAVSSSALMSSIDHFNKLIASDLGREFFIPVAFKDIPSVSRTDPSADYNTLNVVVEEFKSRII